MPVCWQKNHYQKGVPVSLISVQYEFGLLSIFATIV